MQTDDATIVAQANGCFGLKVNIKNRTNIHFRVDDESKAIVFGAKLSGESITSMLLPKQLYLKRLKVKEY